MLRLRQICLVAHDRDTVVGHLESVLSVHTAYEDPGVATFGLHNAVRSEEHTSDSSHVSESRMPSSA